METKGYIYLIRICCFCLTIFSDWCFFCFFFFAVLVSLLHIFVCHSLQHTVKMLSIMSPKVMYPQQQIYHITFGMNVINWHASTDNWAAAYRLLQNYTWASEDADQPAHHWSILWQCHIWSHWKKCIKSQVKETFKFALFGHSYKMFHLTLKLCPRWWSAPAPCLCTCIKSRKNCI